ncbi:MAG: hypothetical protein ACLFRY_05830 [Spirochaetia bacterium]
MNVKGIAFFVLFVIAGATLQARDFRFHHHLTGGFRAALNRADPFPVKMQPQEEIAYGLLFQLFPFLGIGLETGLDFVQPSSLSGGFQYRGYTAYFLGLSLGGRYIFPNEGKEHTYSLGAAVAGRGNYAWYDGINRFFFFLSFVPEVFFEFLPRRDHLWHLRIGLPVALNFRRDIALSMEPGVRISIYHRPIYHIRRAVERSRGGS